MSLSDEARTVSTTPGTRAGLDRLVEALPPDEAAEVLELLLDDSIGHSQAHAVLLRHYADHPVFVGRPLMSQAVSNWRTRRGIKRR